MPAWRRPLAPRSLLPGEWEEGGTPVTIDVGTVLRYGTHDALPERPAKAPALVLAKPTWTAQGLAVRGHDRRRGQRAPRGREGQTGPRRKERGRGAGEPREMEGK